eukprot:CAMPEP_0171488888 /NCGR_PEP_ID=MMETSP0958-20121227/2452_1 /TAXON_ID=87120 /ORGANISM="Aurantiochytrium limacinum, Strain ATCCMYA-1381" /LENGTH=113 /DNA_ID=CAMNT_0012022041 /DNA_START=54 /DNA_END=395 /DNA_ORIENTATION=+
MASSTAKLVLAASCVFTTSAVVYVHWAQENDRWTMYQNVLHDIEKEKAEAAMMEAAIAAAKERGVKINITESCPTGICDLQQSRIVSNDEQECTTGLCDLKQSRIVEPEKASS